MPPLAFNNALRAFGSDGIERPRALRLQAPLRVFWHRYRPRTAPRHTWLARAPDPSARRRQARPTEVVRAPHDLTASERGIGSQPRAHECASIRRRERRVVDQIARMRNQHMGCKAAVNCGAEMPRRSADIFITRLAGGALSATDPGINRDLRAGSGVGIRSHILQSRRQFRGRA